MGKNMKVDVREVENEPTIVYATGFFTVKTTQHALDNFKAKLEKKSKKRGMHYTEEQKMLMRCFFVQKKMHPINDCNIFGEQYYDSKVSLIKQIFGVDYE